MSNGLTILDCRTNNTVV